MSEVMRVPFEVSGLTDAVELKANCSVIRLKTKGGVVTGVRGEPRLHPCKLMASYEEGSLTLSIPEIGLMASVRLDETMAVLMEASSYSIEAREEESNGKEGAAPQG